jgi:hypothetical protein
MAEESLARLAERYRRFAADEAQVGLNADVIWC